MLILLFLRILKSINVLELELFEFKNERIYGVTEVLVVDTLNIRKYPIREVCSFIYFSLNIY